MNENIKAGLTATGFKRKTFVDISKEIEQELKAAFGKVNCDDRSVLGQIKVIFAEREANIWEKLAAIYHSQYPSTAEGISLDGVCALSGIKRLGATYTKVLCQLTAVNYTTIPKGSEVLIETTGNQFVLLETITITNERCQAITLRVSGNVAEYSLNINNHKIVYEPRENKNIETTISKLVEFINDADIGVKAELNDENIIINSTEVAKSFSCFVSEGITIISCTNNALFKAKKKGAVIAPSFAVDTIQTPVQGWIGISNINAGIAGRELENDAGFRARREASLKRSGNGTVDSIKSRLLDVKGVSFVKVVDNFKNEPDVEGRPAKSFEALVLGGSDKAIAQVLWQVKPAGIESWGNLSVITKDSNGRNQLIKFSRPVIKYIYASLRLKVLENFDPANVEIIKLALVKQINSLGVNTKLIYQSLFASVYCVAGIMNADIKIGATTIEENLPNLEDKSIEAKTSEIVATDLSKIVIEVA